MKEKLSYCVYEFMLRFDLTKSERAVYAFIFAYRKTSFGIYFGSRAFIAKECGVSLRTIQRAKSSLLKKGLIEEVESGDFYGLRCVMEKVPASFRSPKPREDGEAPEFETVDVGKGYFAMTRAQIAALLKLVTREEFDNYVIRVEKMLEKNTGEVSPPHSYYKTIKKWIYEDYSV